MTRRLSVWAKAHSGEAIRIAAQMTCCATLFGWLAALWLMAACLAELMRGGELRG